MCMEIIPLTVDGIEIWDTDYGIPKYCPYCGVKISDYVIIGAENEPRV